MRARPVPFWRQSFLPEPETSERVLVLCVPARSAGEVGLHRLVDQMLLVRIGEDLVGQLDLARPLVVEFLTSIFIMAFIPRFAACADRAGSRSCGPGTAPRT